MDWVMIEKPDGACAALLDAKNNGQGVTFSSHELWFLVEFSRNFKAINAFSSDFKQLFGKAIKAVQTKTNFALTAGEVRTWFDYFESVQATRIAAVKIWVHNSDDEPVVKLYEKMEKVYPGFQQDTFVSLAMRLHAATLKGEEGIWLREPARKYLHDFCHLHEDEGNITPVKEIGDPIHPRVTAMKKLCRATKSDPVYLDSEEASSMNKLMQKFNGYSEPATEESQSQAAAREKQEVKMPETPSSTTRDNGQTKGVQPGPLAPKDANHGAKTTSAPVRKETPNSQAKPVESKALPIDNALKDMVLRYRPNVVPGVLNSKQFLIIRWLKPLEDAFDDLETRHDKLDKDLEDLRSVMAEDENEYEQELAAAAQEYADLNIASQEKLALVESGLQTATDSLSKQMAAIEKKHEEQLQIERDMYSKLKKDGDDKFAKVESELQTANNKIEKAKTAFAKHQAQFNLKLQSSKNETKAWEDNFNEEVAKSNVLRLDYDATLQEIGELKAEHTKMAEREARCVALENEVAALRSSRTNPQVEKDNIAKAVRNAIADKQAEVDKARAELGKLAVELQETQAQLTKQSQLSNQWEVVVKEKEKTIAFLDKKLFDKEDILNETNNVLSKTNDELEVARQSTPDAKLLRDLEEERMESQHLKDRMESVAALLQELTLQLMVG